MGKPYRLVMSKLGARWPIPGIHLPGRAEAIVDGLFPTHPPRVRVEWPRDEEIVPVTEREIEELDRNILSNKAPGPSGMPGKAVRLWATSKPAVVAFVYNRCLEQGVFLAKWKRARLVLIRKNNKPLEKPSFYRPLCMLDPLRKLMEKNIDVRLKAICEAKQLLTTNQYGFRGRGSTVNAIERVMRIVRVGLRTKSMVGVLLLDIRNAFKSAPWHIIAATMRSK